MSSLKFEIFSLLRYDHFLIWRRLKNCVSSSGGNSVRRGDCAERK